MEIKEIDLDSKAFDENIVCWSMLDVFNKC